MIKDFYVCDVLELLEKLEDMYDKGERKYELIKAFREILDEYDTNADMPTLNEFRIFLQSK